MPNKQQAQQALTQLGFTPLEAEVYAFLLRDSPASGYRITQALARPVANVYKAISGLEARGAIRVEGGESRLCRAVPPEELTRHLSLEFETACGRARRALSEFSDRRPPVNFNTLRTWEQVVERSKDMLARAEQVALATVSGEFLNDLRPALKHAAWRGVDVVMKAFEPIEIPGVEVIVASEPERYLESLGFCQVNLAIDVHEGLVAIARADSKQVLEAGWSDSPFLRLLLFNGLSLDITFSLLLRNIAQGRDQAALLEIVRRLRLPIEKSGFVALMQRFEDLKQAAATDDSSGG